MGSNSLYYLEVLILVFVYYCNVELNIVICLCIYYLELVNVSFVDCRIL